MKSVEKFREKNFEPPEQKFYCKSAMSRMSDLCHVVKLNAFRNLVNHERRLRELAPTFVNRALKKNLRVTNDGSLISRDGETCSFLHTRTQKH